MGTSLSTFKIFCVGGFSEVAKNCFFIEYNNEMVIFNYGNYPSPNNNLGISIKIPNINYLLKKKDHIKAIFFTNMSEDNIGGYRYLFSKIKTPIYASKLTIDWLKNHDKNGEIFKGVDFHLIEEKRTINFNYYKITPFSLDSNIFNSFNYLIEHNFGKVFYLNDYFLNFEPESIKPTKLLKELEFIHQQENNNFHNTIVLSSAGGYLKKQFACFNSSIDEFFQDIFHRHLSQRIFISIYNFDFLKIKKLIHLISKARRSIYFINKKFYQFLKFLEENNHFSFYDLRVIEDFNAIAKNTIIFITGKSPQVLKDILLLIYSPKNLKITKDDVFVSLTKPIPGFELLGVEIFNEFIRLNTTFYFLPKIYENSYPSRFDILTTLKFINPKWFVPTSTHYNNNIEIIQDIAKSNLGFNGLLVENGDCIVINKNNVYLNHKLIDADSLFLQSINQKLITNDILSERILLLNNGIFVATCGISFYNNKIVTNLDCQDKGLSLKTYQRQKIREIIINNISKTLINLDNTLSEIEKFKKVISTKNEITKLVQNFLCSIFKTSPVVEINFFII